MPSHFFDRFYVVTKFILPTINDLIFSPVDFDSECIYLNVDLRRIYIQCNIFQKSRTFIRKLCHLMISIRNKLIIIIEQPHDILTKEISLTLPNIPKDRKVKRSIIASLVILVTLVTGFIRLAYEGISIYLHNRRQKALQKAFMATKNQVSLE